MNPSHSRLDSGRKNWLPVFAQRIYIFQAKSCTKICKPIFPAEPEQRAAPLPGIPSTRRTRGHVQRDATPPEWMLTSGCCWATFPARSSWKPERDSGLFMHHYSIQKARPNRTFTTDKGFSSRSAYFLRFLLLILTAPKSQLFSIDVNKGWIRHHQQNNFSSKWFLIDFYLEANSLNRLLELGSQSKPVLKIVKNLQYLQPHQTADKEHSESLRLFIFQFWLQRLSAAPGHRSCPVITWRGNMRILVLGRRRPL